MNFSNAFWAAFSYLIFLFTIFNKYARGSLPLDLDELILAKFNVSDNGDKVCNDGDQEGAFEFLIGYDDGAQFHIDFIKSVFSEIFSYQEYEVNFKSIYSLT